MYFLFLPNNNNFDRLIEQSTTLARFREFAASFGQQDRFCVRESKEEKDSKSTVFEVRQKINDKLVAKIVISITKDNTIHSILIISSSNIHVVPIKSIFKILPWDHEVWITNVGKMDYSAAKLLENMLREYEPPSSKFTANSSTFKFFIEDTNSKLICKFEVSSKLNIWLFKSTVQQTENEKWKTQQKEIIAKRKHKKEETEEQEEMIWLHFRDQSLLIIKNFQHLVIYLHRQKTNDIFIEDNSQLIAFKRCRSLSWQYESKELIKDDFCYEFYCK